MASPQIPLDMVLDILSLLLVKSLLRFKCVSKSWLSLISSPLFIKSHLKKHTRDTRLIFSSIDTDREFTQCSLYPPLCGTNIKATHLEFPTKFRTQSIQIVGSCNGLLCIAIKSQCVVIWNPSIKKYKTLPFDQGLRSLRKPLKISYGFEYDDLNDDYKVVKFYYHWITESTPPPREVRVYSTRKNSWRRIEDDLNCVPPCETPHGIFSNGRIHWITKDMHSGTRKILTFDLANEKYAEIQLPEILQSRASHIWRWNLGVLGEGCLSLSCDGGENSSTMDVWIMMEYGAGQSWTRVASIRLPCDDRVTTSFSKPVLVSKNGEILFQCRRELALYNPEKGSIRKLGIRPMIRCGVQCLKVDIYKESLVWMEEEELKRRHEGLKL